MRSGKKILIIILIFIVMVNLTGCWNNRDLTELGLTTAVGIDKTSDSNIELTVQLVKPEVLQAKKQGSTAEAFWTFSATGKTIFSAIRNLLTTVNRKVFFSHVQLMVIGEEVARDGLLDVLDLFERDQETRRIATMVITKGIKASEILRATSELESIPAMHISEVLKNNVAVAKIVNVNLIDTLKSINAPGTSPVIGVIMKREQKKEQKGQKSKQSGQSSKQTDQKQGSSGEKIQIKDLKIEGTAVFKKDKLVGWLGPIETRGLLFIRNQVQSGIINTANPLEKNKQLAFEIVRSSGKMDVKMKQGKPELIIVVKTEGRLEDQQGRGDFTKAKMIKKLEHDVGRVIEKEVRNTMKLAQKKYKSDFLGFASIVHRKYPDYWKKNKNNWTEIFSQAQIRVKAVWKTRTSSVLKQSSQAR